MKGANICPDPELPAYADRYQFWYPLRDWGLDRKACGQVIVDAGLPLPCKSACFFCPAMRQIEIERLRVVDPDRYALAIEMEQLYRGGHHFRGDDFFTVKGKRKDTGEEEVLEVRAISKDAARGQFRAHFDDTDRPYRYTLHVYQAVPGLGRNFAWSSLPVLSD